MITQHTLKCLPPYFQAVYERSKNFEVRLNDRDYKVGDILHLREFSGDYTGRGCFRKVTYVLPGGSFGLEPDYCILSLT